MGVFPHAVALFWIDACCGLLTQTTSVGARCAAVTGVTTRSAIATTAQRSLAPPENRPRSLAFSDGNPSRPDSPCALRLLRRADGGAHGRAPDRGARARPRPCARDRWRHRLQPP